MEISDSTLKKIALRKLRKLQDYNFQVNKIIIDTYKYFIFSILIILVLLFLEYFNLLKSGLNFKDNKGFIIILFLFGFYSIVRIYFITKDKYKFPNLAKYSREEIEEILQNINKTYNLKKRLADRFFRDQRFYFVLLFFYIALKIYLNVSLLFGHELVEFLFTNFILVLILISMLFGLFHRSKKIENSNKQIHIKIRNKIVDYLINSKFNPFIDENRRKCN